MLLLVGPRLISVPTLTFTTHSFSSRAGPRGLLEPTLPCRSKLDFAISIATLHHLSTPERRLEAPRLILSSIKPSHPSRTGRVLIFVWAHEQGERSRRKALPPTYKTPWFLNINPGGNSTEKIRTYNQYYHLFFRKGELIKLVKSAAESLELFFKQLDSNQTETSPLMSEIGATSNVTAGKQIMGG
ncbi:hypothetical protein Pst134EB_026603 [Puccinia striiformis f. sp. tritici]|nr:hypothetical protein Pst134EB_026603 [Puccinia striiformis f. sp. tritici]